MTSAMEQLAIDSRTGVDIYQWLREVCSTKLQQTPTVLGGPGVIVQIDESHFRHKPKVRLRVVGIMVVMYSSYCFNSITEEDPQPKRYILRNGDTRTSVIRKGPYIPIDPSWLASTV